MTLFRADCNYSLAGGAGTQFPCSDDLGLVAELFLWRKRKHSEKDCARIVPEILDFLTRKNRAGD